MSATTLVLYGPAITGDLEIYAGSLREAFPALNVVVPASESALASHAPGARILVARTNDVTQGVLDALGELEWIHSLLSGTDAFARLRLPEGAIVTSTRGIHGPPVAEHCLFLMLALARNAGRIAANQKARRWERLHARMLCEQTVTVVGLGNIGRAIGVRCQALGMRVVGISRHSTAAPGFDRVRPSEELAAAARETDILVVSSASTARTRAMIDAAVLAALPAHALLVNVARGDVVDEAALVEALREGRIAGAGLDVFESEPLPEDHPLWSLPNVIVTPHLGGVFAEYPRKAWPILRSNLEAFLAGRTGEMTNRVR